MASDIPPSRRTITVAHAAVRGKLFFREVLATVCHVLEHSVTRSASGEYANADVFAGGGDISWCLWLVPGLPAHIPRTHPYSRLSDICPESFLTCRMECFGSAGRAGQQGDKNTQPEDTLNQGAADR